MTAVGEGEEGVDLKALEEGLQAYERDVEVAEVSVIIVFLLCWSELNRIKGD